MRATKNLLLMTTALLIGGLAGSCELPKFVPPETVESCEQIASWDCVAPNQPDLILTCEEGGIVQLNCYDVCTENLAGTWNGDCSYSASLDHDVCWCEDGGGNTSGGNTTGDGDDPCDGFPKQFNGVLGSPCDADGIPLAQCAKNSDGYDVSAHCDLKTCTWKGQVCAPNKPLECSSCNNLYNACYTVITPQCQ